VSLTWWGRRCCAIRSAHEQMHNHTKHRSGAPLVDAPTRTMDGTTAPRQRECTPRSQPSRGSSNTAKPCLEPPSSKTPSAALSRACADLAACLASLRAALSCDCIASASCAALRPERRRSSSPSSTATAAEAPEAAQRSRSSARKHCSYCAADSKLSDALLKPQLREEAARHLRLVQSRRCLGSV